MLKEKLNVCKYHANKESIQLRYLKVNTLLLMLS